MGNNLEPAIVLFLAVLFAAMPHLAAAKALDGVGGASAIASPQGSSSGNFEIISNSEGYKQTLEIPSSQMLFNVSPIYDNQGNQVSFLLSLKPELDAFYHSVGLYDKPKDTVFVYPSFTQAAYGQHGFYDYYRKQCGSSCLTVPIPDKVSGVQASSIAGAWILKLLGYPFVMDQDIDKNPDILKQYKRVIILHSEYVTQKEFDAITSHPNVVFLYPNALYAQVMANYGNNTITLVRGHGYPNTSIKNGFGWKNDNSKYEYDVACNDWNFYHKGNYVMLNCYPEYKLLTSGVMLGLLQKDDPTTLLDDVTNWLMYPEDQNGTEKMLDDFDIDGSNIPSWVQKPALWLSNGEISRGEFDYMMHYLFQNHIVK
ncbi:MAG: hypothetical protein KGI27_12825 [Thaumarchaeota archaeon]|nr:hypothetical protein [Nitrososphaerota archaeon]